jgi:hypothetical protein
VFDPNLPLFTRFNIVAATAAFPFKDWFPASASVIARSISTSSIFVSIAV